MMDEYPNSSNPKLDTPLGLAGSIALAICMSTMLGVAGYFTVVVSQGPAMSACTKATTPNQESKQCRFTNP